MKDFEYQKVYKTVPTLKERKKRILEIEKYHKFLIKKYPELIKLMKTFFKKDLSKDYRNFIIFKNKIKDENFYNKYIKYYYTECIESESFGTKIFYKTNDKIMYYDLFKFIY